MAKTTIGLKRTATYQDIEIALAKDGCPICRVGQKFGRSHLELLLWGSVNDPNIRGRLTEALGFCDRHSQVLLTFSGERLGVAIVEQAVLKEALRRLDRAAGPAKRSLLARLLVNLSRGAAAEAESPIQPAGPCPVCQTEADVELRAIEVLLGNLNGDLEARLDAAGGLCYPHLERALQINHDPAAHTILLRVQRQVWQRLIDQLGEYIRKRDYRFSHEMISEEEGLAIEGAVAGLTGQKLFPAE